MNSSNRKHEPITLYCARPTQTGDSETYHSESDDSDFPPCRIGSDSPIISRSSDHPIKSRYLRYQSAHSPPPSMGLGQRNILNTVNVATKLKPGDCSPGKTLLKRRRSQGSTAQESSNERPLKRRTPVDDNMTLTRLRRDIAGLEEIVSETREDIACIKENLEELAHEVREERDNLHTMLAELLAEVQRDLE